MNRPTQRPDLSFRGSVHGWRFSVIEAASEAYFEVALIDAAGELRPLVNSDTVAVLRRDNVVRLLATLIARSGCTDAAAVAEVNRAVNYEKDGAPLPILSDSRAVLRTLFHYYAKGGYGTEPPTIEVSRAVDYVDDETLANFVTALVLRKVSNDLVPSRVSFIRESSGL
jgi:hypothetical protein